MSRIKRGTISLKKRKKTLKLTKGFRYARSRKERAAKVAIYHAGNNAFAHRRRKKGDFRRLWNIRLSAALKPFELSYSRFIDMMTKKSIGLNRKMLSEMAVSSPEVFERVVTEVKG